MEFVEVSFISECGFLAGDHESRVRTVMLEPMSQK